MSICTGHRWPSLLCILCLIVSLSPLPTSSRPEDWLQNPASAIQRRAGPFSRPLDWRPQPGKALLALCTNGGLSMQLRCLRNTFLLAGILNRTLVVPEMAVAHSLHQSLPPWNWTTVVNFRRMATCLEPSCGPFTVLTLPAFLKATKQKQVAVRAVHCLAATRSECFRSRLAKAVEKHANGQLALPFAGEEPVEASPLDLEGGKEASVDDVARAFGGVEDEVLAVGDVADVALQTPGGILSNPTPSEECVNVWRPHPAVMSFVDGILDTLLGSNYAAVYWKRGQETQTSPAEDEPPHHKDLVPVTEVARRVRKKLEGTSASVLYVATDARKAELSTFESLLKDPGLGKRFPAILSLRAILVDEEWLLEQFWSKDALLMEREQKNGVALALVDKFVCARAKYFLGTASSKFSEDILEIRKGEGLSNPPEMGDFF